MKTLNELRFERTSSMNLKIIKRACLENVNNIFDSYTKGCHKSTVYAMTQIKIKIVKYLKKVLVLRKEKDNNVIYVWLINKL